MSDFTKQELALIHDLINIAWQSGVVKSPQMGQGLEQLRQKIVMKLEPPPAPPKEEKPRKEMKT